MAFLSGSVSFERFRVTGKTPKQFGDDQIEILQKHAIGKIQTASEENIHVGFLGGSHLLDTEFDLEKNIVPKMKRWNYGDPHFVVLRDQDGGEIPIHGDDHRAHVDVARVRKMHGADRDARLRSGWIDLVRGRRRGHRILRRGN